MTKRRNPMMFVWIALGCLALGCGGAGLGTGPFRGLVFLAPGNDIWTSVSDGTNAQLIATEDVFVSSMSENGKIYTSFGSSTGEIVILRSNGSFQEFLTTNNDNDFRPAVTPDGSKVAFVSERDGNREVYIMNGDGSNQVNLSNNASEDTMPAISADGTKVLFQSERDGNTEVYSVNANGTGLTRLTNDASDDITPAWSPNGTEILFCTDRDGNFEVYRANANGSSPVRITNTALVEVHASWNLSGTHIFYYDNVSLKRMLPDGSGVETFTAGAGKTCTWVYP